MFLIFKINATRGKEDPLGYLKILFAGVYKNTNYFNTSFCGNIKPVKTPVDEKTELLQCKKEPKKLQKRALEAQVVPVEVC